MRRATKRHEARILLTMSAAAREREAGAASDGESGEGRKEREATTGPSRDKRCKLLMHLSCHVA